MSQKNPSQAFFSPENVTGLYRTVQSHLKDKYDVEIGREYLESLIETMKMIIQPIKRVPKDVDTQKFVSTLNKRTLAEAIPIFVKNTLGPTVPIQSQTPSSQSPRGGSGSGTQSTPLSEIRGRIQANSRSNQLPMQSPQGTSLQARLPPTPPPPSPSPRSEGFDPRIAQDVSGAFNQLANSRRDQDRKRPPMPNFADPEPVYEASVDDLYKQAEQEHQTRTDDLSLPPPSREVLNQLPFQTTEHFKVLQQPKIYENIPGDGFKDAIAPHHHVFPNPRKPRDDGVPLNTTDGQMSTPITQLVSVSETTNDDFADMVPRVNRQLVDPVEYYDFTKVANRDTSEPYNPLAPQPAQLRVLIPRTSRNWVHDSRNIPFTVAIDSSNKGPTESDNQYHIRLNDEIKDVVSLELRDAQIPITDYVVNTSNNVLYWEETPGTTLSTVLTPGNYTAAELATELKTQLDATATLGEVFTITINSNQETYTIAHDGAGGAVFRFLFFGGLDENTGVDTYLPRSAGPLIGFSPQDLTGSLTYTGDLRYNLKGDSYLLLFVREAELIDSPDSNVKNAFAKIVLDAELGCKKFYNRNVDNRFIKYFSPPVGRLARLTIEFRRPNGDLYEFNGHTNSLTFEIISKDKTVPPYEEAARAPHPNN